MKKMENTFAVTGFVGKDASIHQFSTASPKKDTKATPHLRMWQHGTMEYTNECQRKQLYAEVCSRRNMMQRTSITNPWL